MIEPLITIAKPDGLYQTKAPSLDKNSTSKQIAEMAVNLIQLIKQSKGNEIICPNVHLLRLVSMCARPMIVLRHTAGIFLSWRAEDNPVSPPAVAELTVPPLRAMEMLVQWHLKGVLNGWSLLSVPPEQRVSDSLCYIARESAGFDRLLFLCLSLMFGEDSVSFISELNGRVTYCLTIFDCISLRINNFV